MVYAQSGIPFWGVGGEMTVRKKRGSGIKKEYAAAPNRGIHAQHAACPIKPISVMVLVRTTYSYNANLCLALFSVLSAELCGCVWFVQNYLTHTHTHTHTHHTKRRSQVTCHTKYTFMMLHIIKYISRQMPIIFL